MIEQTSIILLSYLFLFRISNPETYSLEISGINSFYLFPIYSISLYLTNMIWFYWRNNHRSSPTIYQSILIFLNIFSLSVTPLFFLRDKHYVSRNGGDTIFNIISYILFEEFLFYVVHRLMHTKIGYILHKTHHEPKILTPIYAQYASIFETIITSFVLGIPIQMLSLSLTDIYIAAPLYITSNVASHTEMFKDRHWKHHKYRRGNYGNISIFDYFFDSEINDSTITSEQ